MIKIIFLHNQTSVIREHCRKRKWRGNRIRRRKKWISVRLIVMSCSSYNKSEHSLQISCVSLHIQVYFIIEHCRKHVTMLIEFVHEKMNISAAISCFLLKLKQTWICHCRSLAETIYRTWALSKLYSLSPRMKAWNFHLNFIRSENC